ncbi:hypothetical protein BDY24DRAFT_400057 [Mrakia frigida]|uniref:uncharacterized protein n=1 Tax=Mrakia frigida TaxID=29902 RepID=UPI003FCC1F0E
MSDVKDLPISTSTLLVQATVDSQEDGPPSKKRARLQEETISSVIKRDSASLLSMPYEIIKLIADEVWDLKRADLKSLSLTCSRLRRIAISILFRYYSVSLSYDTPKSKLDSLLALATSDLGLQVIHASFWKLYRHPTLPFPLRTLLVPIVEAFRSLVSLEFPSNFISNSLLDVLHDHPTLETLETSPFTNVLPNVFRFELNHARSRHQRSRRVVASPRPAGTLQVRNLLCRLPSDDLEGTMVRFGQLVDLVDSYGFVMEEIGIGLPSLGIDDAARIDWNLHPCPLTQIHLPNLTSLRLYFHPRSFNTGGFMLGEILKVQRQVSSLHFDVSTPAADFEDFSLVERGFLPRVGSGKEMSVVTKGEWAGVRVLSVEGDYERGGEVDDSFVLKSLKIGFMPGTVLDGRKLAGLMEDDLFAGTQEVEFSNCLWDGAWNSTLFRMNPLPSLASLASLTFNNASLTERPTFGRTLACSPECYSDLDDYRPDLCDAAKLVGGYQAFLQLLFNINYNQFCSLARSLPPGCRLRLAAKPHFLEGEVLALETVVGREELGVRVTPERDGDDADWEGGLLDGSKCFLCLEEPSRRRFNWTDRRRRQAEDLGDPVEALMKCAVSDVLEALREVGFDVEAFGDSPPSEPIYPDTFESFLRTGLARS